MPTDRLVFKTGLKVFDWLIPKEWIVRDAYLIDPNGKKRAEYKVNNLHLIGYSVPFSGRMGLAQLRPQIHSLPGQPDAIPYLTTYYRENWGFCMSDRELQSLPEGEYQVCIDTELVDGHLEIGEAVIKGKSDREVLFSTYLCHPSMANNELSGPLLASFLYERISEMRNLHYTYRFVVQPETIGSIAYLSKRGDWLKEKLDAGFVITCVGDAGLFTYKSSRRGNALCDRVAKLILRDIGEHRLEAFAPFGSDERQYCSPGFNLPVGSLMRTMYGRFPEYHTSLDDKLFISFDAMTKALEAYLKIVSALEGNWVWKTNFPFCEPQLGKRGLYPTLGAQKQRERKVEALMWILNLADGKSDLLEIAERSGCEVEMLISVASEAEVAGLISKI